MIPHQLNHPQTKAKPLFPPFFFASGSQTIFQMYHKCMVADKCSHIHSKMIGCTENFLPSWSQNLRDFEEWKDRVMGWTSPFGQFQQEGPDWGPGWWGKRRVSMRCGPKPKRDLFPRSPAAGASQPRRPTKHTSYFGFFVNVGPLWKSGPPKTFKATCSAQAIWKQAGSNQF